MASDNSRKRVPQRYGDMPDKWDDWHVRLPDPKDQLRVIDLYHWHKLQSGGALSPHHREGNNDTNPVAGAYPLDKRTHRPTREGGEFDD